MYFDFAIVESIHLSTTGAVPLGWFCENLFTEIKNGWI